MRDIILLKQGEMVLKGLNTHRFDQILQNNIRGVFVLKNTGGEFRD